MKFNRIAATVALAVATLAGASAAFAADWTVGANIGNVPWEFQDATGKFVGFEIDMVNEVAKRAGKSVQIENIPFNGLFPAVQSGRIQMAMSSITITPKRLESLAFAQPYYDSDQSLSVLKNTKIDKLEDLAGKTVGVDTASTGDIYATQNTAKLKIATISPLRQLRAPTRIAMPKSTMLTGVPLSTPSHHTLNALWSTARDVVMTPIGAALQVVQAVLQRLLPTRQQSVCDGKTGGRRVKP